ncbi:MAG: polysaccharide deacetylase family protein [Pseudomonadota bacterium]|nr:polysaccharide deacetylase family protein [Pseudomonadota bacterium]
MVRAFKAIAKDAVNGAIASAGPLLLRLRRRPGLLILMYHRVLPERHPDRTREQPGMYVSPGTLDLHIRTLKELGFRFVHLDDWVRSTRRFEEHEGHSCAVTFDDGWRDNYDHAFPVLQAHAVPATIFLVSDMVGGDYSFWPNRLTRLLGAGSGDVLAAAPQWLRDLCPRIPDSPLQQHEIDVIIGICKQQCTDQEMMDILNACESQLPAIEVGRSLMDWNEISRLAASGLVRFGSHTRTHARLTKVRDAAQLQDELEGSCNLIRQRLGIRPVLFCYPNGDTSTKVAAAVRAHYSAAVTTRRGWCRPGVDLLALPRIGLHEDVSSTRSAFVARIVWSA